MDGATSDVTATSEEVEVKHVEWEAYQEVWGQMCGRGSVFKKALADREALKQQLETRLEGRTVAITREDDLEAMQRQVNAKKLKLRNAQESLRKQREELIRKTECVVPKSRTLQVAFKAEGDARRRLQIAEKLLSGEGGQERLRRLCYLLDARRRRMLAEIVSFYPLVSLKQPIISSTKETEREAHGSLLRIAGMALTEPGKKLAGFGKDRSENEMTATALGYVGHVVTLAARYFDVQLRYPLRLMGSRSFIQDRCPSVEPPVVDAVTEQQRSMVEFPLFSEGQDQTRSAYAVFLLNKNLEQILNYLGLESVGPRHTLLNLEKLLKAQSCDSN